MPYTFLTAINNSLKRAQVIQGATGALTTFTAPAIQTDVDVMIMAWNEVIQDIATLPILVPGLADQGTYNLTAGNKEYAIPVGSVTGKQIETVKLITNLTFRWPLGEYPGGYDKMVRDQPDPSIFQGNPMFWCINPGTNQIRYDFTPTAQTISGAQGGAIKHNIDGAIGINLQNPTDTFTFSDRVVDQLVDAVAMIWTRERKKGDWSRDAYMQRLSNAIRYATKTQPRSQYGVVRRRA